MKPFLAALLSATFVAAGTAYAAPTAGPTPQDSSSAPPVETAPDASSHSHKPSDTGGVGGAHGRPNTNRTAGITRLKAALKMLGGTPSI